DQRSGLSDVWEANDIRCRCVGCENPELVGEGEVVDVIQIARAKHVLMLPLPFYHRHARECPKITLTSALEIQVVIKLLDRRIGWKAVDHLQLAEPRIYSTRGGKSLRNGQRGRQADQCSASQRGRGGEGRRAEQGIASGHHSLI